MCASIMLDKMTTVGNHDQTEVPTLEPKTEDVINNVTIEDVGKSIFDSERNDGWGMEFDGLPWVNPTPSQLQIGSTVQTTGPMLEQITDAINDLPSGTVDKFLPKIKQILHAMVFYHSLSETASRQCLDVWWDECGLPCAQPMPFHPRICSRCQTGEASGKRQEISVN